LQVISFGLPSIHLGSLAISYHVQHICLDQLIVPCREIVHYLW